MVAEGGEGRVGAVEEAVDPEPDRLDPGDVGRQLIGGRGRTAAPAPRDRRRRGRRPFGSISVAAARAFRAFGFFGGRFRFAGGRAGDGFAGFVHCRPFAAEGSRFVAGCFAWF